ncbi:MAG: DUF2283 domain-containing protein [Candidatus Wukongarchaeota archaeon]|nr:DUF2283 domain-containing protein [Candidatus Wukongarchaeota archaeon]
MSYDPEVDAFYIVFQEGKYDISKEIADGIIIDYTKDGKVIGIEILDMSLRVPLENIEETMINIPIKKRKELPVE